MPGSVNAGCPTRGFLVLSEGHEGPASWRSGLVIVALNKRSRQPCLGLCASFRQPSQALPLRVEDNTSGVTAYKVYT